MFNFTVDHSQASEGFGKIQDGRYEVFIDSATENATQSGTEYLDVRLRIRNDVQQNHQNQIIFHRIWKAKATGQYVMGMLQQIAKYAQIPNGQQFNSVEQFAQAITNKPLVVEVKNETSEYNGNTYENLNVKDMDFTDYPNLQHTAGGNNGGGQPQINTAPSNPDLPF